MSPDIRIVADPPLPTLAALLEDNRHKLVTAEGMHLERSQRCGGSLCLLFGNGAALQLIAANTRDGSKALLGALEVLETLADDADVTVLLLSPQPPPGQRWLQNRTVFTWVRTQVLDIDGRTGLLLELHDKPAAPMSSPTAPTVAQRMDPNSHEIDTLLADSLTDEEVAFLQHL